MRLKTWGVANSSSSGAEQPAEERGRFEVSDILPRADRGRSSPTRLDEVCLFQTTNKASFFILFFSLFITCINTVLLYLHVFSSYLYIHKRLPMVFLFLDAIDFSYSCAVYDAWHGIMDNTTRCGFRDPTATSIHPCTSLAL